MEKCELKKVLKISTHPLVQEYTGWTKKRLRCDLEEKGLRNSKIFFDGVFL